MEQNPMGEEKILKIEKIEKIDAAPKGERSTEQIKEIEAPTKAKFDNALAKADVNFERNYQAQQLKTTNDPMQGQARPSLIEELSQSEAKIQRLQPATQESISTQSDTIRKNLQAPVTSIEDALKANPSIKLSPIDQATLSERLVHIDSSLKTALDAIGGGPAEVKSLPAKSAPTANPLYKFLDYLTHADYQLSNMTNEIQALNLSGNNLTPGKMLAVQIKLSFVQQQLEFFTNVLNKA